MVVTFENRRFVFLLAALAIYFLITPFIVDTPILAFFVGVFLTIVLMSSLYVMRHERRFLILSSVLLALALVGNWLLVFGFSDGVALQFTVYLTTCLFFMVITYFVLRYVMAHKSITFNSLCGAVCGYLLIGLVWSYIYRALYVLSTHHFSGAGISKLNVDGLEQGFTYYSFVTLTTLGYGDIIPNSNIAKMFAWVEALTGQIYLTVWIAQLVAMHISDRRRKKENG